MASLVAGLLSDCQRHDNDQQQKPWQSHSLNSIFRDFPRLCAHVLTTLKVVVKSSSFRFQQPPASKVGPHTATTTFQHDLSTCEYWSLDDHACDLGE
jgi:hypothetical protein